MAVWTLVRNGALDRTEGKSLFFSGERESDTRFEDKVAIVTGAGRGIGYSIALRLANGGARLACVSRTEESAKKDSDEINALRQDSANAYAVDVADQHAVHDASIRSL